MYRVKVYIDWAVVEPWPVYIIVPLAIVPFFVINVPIWGSYTFNGIYGTVLQVVGGLLVVFSIDENLRALGGRGIWRAVVEWWHGRPRKSAAVTATLELRTSSGTTASDGLIRVNIQRNTLEERVGFLEGRLGEIEGELCGRIDRAEASTEALRTELLSRVSEGNTQLVELRKIIREVAVGDPRKEIVYLGLVIVGTFAAYMG